MSETTDLSNEDNNTLSRIIFLLGAEIAEKEAIIKQAKAELARRYAALGDKVPGLDNGLKLTMRPTRRFDVATAQAALSAADLKKVSRMTPIAALAKEHLSPAAYKATQKTYGLTITVAMIEGEAN